MNDIFNDGPPIPVLASPDLRSSDRPAYQVPPTPAQSSLHFLGALLNNAVPSMFARIKKTLKPSIPCKSLTLIASWVSSARTPLVERAFGHQPAPQAQQNMTIHMHRQTTMFAQGEDPDQTPRAILAMLSDLPHFLLGRSRERARHH